MQNNPNYVRKMEDVIEHWRIDSEEVSRQDPDIEASRLNKLHQKYATIKSNNSLMAKAYKKELAEAKLFMYRYYNGKTTVEENKAFGMDEVEMKGFHEKILKTEIPMYLEGDERLLNLKLKIEYHEEIVDYCKDVLKGIDQRNWSIRNIIDWKKFEAGFN